MATLNFPANPVDQEFYEGYIYNATKGVWNSAGAAEPGPLGPTGPTGPLGPSGLENVELIPGNADLNDYTTSGFYAQISSSQANSGNNYPGINFPDENSFVAFTGLLRVLNDGTNVYQEYQTSEMGKHTFWRVYTDLSSGFAWTDWQSFAPSIHDHDDLYFSKLQSDIRYWV